MLRVIPLHLKGMESGGLLSSKCHVMETTNGYGYHRGYQETVQILVDQRNYHDTPQHLKDQLSLAVTRMKRGAAGMVYGRPPHLDAANLVNLAWNEISSQSLKNCFKKANIISSFRASNESNVVNETDKTVDKIVNMLRNTSILSKYEDSDICRDIEMCFNDDNDNSKFGKNTLIVEIEDAMNNALVIGESDVACEEINSENNLVEPSVEVDQGETIHNALQEVVNLEITVGEIKESPFVSSEHVYQAKSALFMLRRILQSGRSAIARERIENSRQMTLFDFM